MPAHIHTGGASQANCLSKDQEIFQWWRQWPVRDEQTTALLQTSDLSLSLSPAPTPCVCVFEATRTSCVTEWLGTGGDLGDVQPRVALLCKGGPGHSLSRPTHLAVVEAPPFVTADSGWVCFPLSLSLRLPLPQFQH